MVSLAELIKEGRTRDAWTKYCGFIDLSMDEFMQVQGRLLREQMEIYSKSLLGKKLFSGYIPKDIEDFRKSIPLTTYKDYNPYFVEKREEVLPVKPSYWVCTSGRLNAYQCKWAPYTPGMVNIHIKNFLASVIFSVCTKKGEFTLKENFKFLYAMAPPPYLTGMVPYGLKNQFPFRYLPTLSAAEKMSFEERNRVGFKLGLSCGIDLFFGVSSVLARIGENFAREEGDGPRQGISGIMAWLRLSKGILKSKMRKRELLPRDVWSLKGIVCAGTDTAFYKERIEHYWGKKPLEIYGGTELGIAATQTWDYEGMTLFPDANFWEFIPEEEYRKSKEDPDYQPATVLMDELESGKRYELVITNFKGGAFVRYRIGDVIKVLDTRNKLLGIELPQIVYEDRMDDVIDLAGFTRITERTIWEALKRAGITQGNWVVAKAFSGGNSIIELYIETGKEESLEAHGEIEEKIHVALRQVDKDYRDLEEIMGYRPLRLIRLQKGTYRRLKKQGKGEHGLAWGITGRVNPPKEVLAVLAHNKIY